MNPNVLPPVEAFTHSEDVQIRFNDIDILGHLNNTVYFSFFDTGKAFFFRHIMNGKIDWKRVETVIANIDCAYIAPVYFGEEIAVLTRCAEIHDKSFKLQQILVEKNTGELKTACETVMVSFDPETKKAVEMPQRWRDALEKSMAESRAALQNKN